MIFFPRLSFKHLIQNCRKPHPLLLSNKTRISINWRKGFTFLRHLHRIPLRFIALLSFFLSLSVFRSFRMAFLLISFTLMFILIYHNFIREASISKITITKTPATKLLAAAGGAAVRQFFEHRCGCISVKTMSKHQHVFVLLMLLFKFQKNAECCRLFR